MNHEQLFEEALGGVPWHELSGAFGCSDARPARGREGELCPTSVELSLWNVPEALRTVARLPGVETSEWTDALDVLRNHACHERTPYPVTAHVVPFVLACALRAGRPQSDDLAQVLCSYLEAALAGVATSGTRSHAQAVLRAFARTDDALAAWQHEAAGFIGLLVEPLRRGALARLEHKTRLSLLDWLGLARLPKVPSWASVRARDELEFAQGARQVAVALVAAKAPGRAPALARRLTELLSPPAERLLRDALPMPVELPAFPAAPRPPVTGGPLMPAQVLFTGEALFIARTEDGRGISVHWPGVSVRLGERVYLDLDAAGRPRVAQRRTEDGGTETRLFGSAEDDRAPRGARATAG